MNSSTRQVINQTLATTNAHVELDHMTTMTEQWGDVSIDASAYYDYDKTEIPVDTSVSKEDIVKIRHTHLYLESSGSPTYFTDMFQYYVDNNLYPATNFFNGEGGGTSDMVPIPDEFINNLDTEEK